MSSWLRTQKLLDRSRAFYTSGGYSMARACKLVEMTALNIVGSVKNMDTWCDANEARAILQATQGDGPP